MNDQVNIWCVMPAAGVGTRMQAHCPKQYLSLAGKTVLEHSVSLFLALKQVQTITVCLSKDDAYADNLALFSNRVLRTDGGNTRAQSVLNGLKSLKNNAANDDWVVVHDAARPCLEPALVACLISQLEQDAVGGLLAVPAKDTLKLVKSDDELLRQPPANNTSLTVSRTLDRALIWQAQTPQMFRYGLLLNAIESALDSGVDITDEASAMEAAGHAVKLVEGSAHNIKITTPEDLALAEFLLSTRQQTAP